MNSFLFPAGLMVGIALSIFSFSFAIKLLPKLMAVTATGSTSPMPFVIKNEDMEKQVEDENIRAFPRMEKFDNVEGLGR